MRSIVVALTGPSGVGKSTTVSSLARRHGWTTVREAYDRLTPRPGLSWSSEAILRRLELRLLREEGRRFLEARAIATSGRPVIADTSFLDPVEYTAGLRLLDLASAATFDAVLTRARVMVGERRLGLPDLTVYLAVSPATRAARATGDPARHPPALRPRHEAVGRVQATVVAPALRRLLPQRFEVVRGSGRPGTVAGRVEALARKVGPLRDPFQSADRALEAIARSLAARAGFGGLGKVKKDPPSPRLPR